MNSTNSRPTALVTGASRGIGKAIAYSLASEGYDLVLTCHNSVSELNKVSEDIRSIYDSRVTATRCDVSNPEEVRQLFAPIQKLDLLVNNAGIAHISLLQSMTDEEWDHVMSTNMSSCFYTCRAAIPLFLKSGNGRIINISSVWGNVGASCEVAYSASKGAVNSFTKSLAKELAPSGISVNAIACGCVDTEMNNHLSEDDKKELADEIPFGRFCSPNEVGKTVSLLAQMPFYLTGQIITLDGGWA